LPAAARATAAPVERLGELMGGKLRHGRSLAAA
jgi:hypothetical protein